MNKLPDDMQETMTRLIKIEVLAEQLNQLGV